MKDEMNEIDELYNKFDELFDKRDYEEIDRQIELFIKEDNSAKLYIALLTACYQWQRFLKKYNDLIPIAKKKLEDKGYTEIQVNATMHGFDKAPDSLLLWKNGIPYSKKI